MSFDRLPAELLVMMSERVDVDDLVNFVLVNKDVLSNSTKRMKQHRSYQRKYARIQIGPTDFEPRTGSSYYPLALQLLRELVEDLSIAKYVRHLDIGDLDAAAGSRILSDIGFDGWEAELDNLRGLLLTRGQAQADDEVYNEAERADLADARVGSGALVPYNPVEALEVPPRRLFCQMFENLQSFRGSNVGYDNYGAADLSMRHVFCGTGHIPQHRIFDYLSSLSLTFEGGMCVDRKLLHKLCRLSCLKKLQMVLCDYRSDAPEDPTNGPRDRLEFETLESLELLLYNGSRTSFLSGLLSCAPSLKALHVASNTPLPSDTLGRITSNVSRCLERLSLLGTVDRDREPEPRRNTSLASFLPEAHFGAPADLRYLHRLEDLELDTSWLLPGSSNGRAIPVIDIAPRQLRYLGLWLQDDPGFQSRGEKRLFRAFDGYIYNWFPVLSELRLPNASTPLVQQLRDDLELSDVEVTRSNLYARDIWTQQCRAK